MLSRRRRPAARASPFRRRAQRSPQPCCRSARTQRSDHPPVPPLTITSVPPSPRRAAGRPAWSCSRQPRRPVVEPEHPKVGPSQHHLDRRGAHLRRHLDAGERHPPLDVEVGRTPRHDRHVGGHAPLPALEHGAAPSNDHLVVHNQRREVGDLTPSARRSPRPRVELWSTSHHRVRSERGGASSLEAPSDPAQAAREPVSLPASGSPATATRPDGGAGRWPGRRST